MSNFNIFGLGSGIDWQRLIDSTTQSQTEAVQRTLGRKSVKITGKQQAYSSIKTFVDELKRAAGDFEFAKDFKVKTVSSTDSTKVKGTASISATNQSFRVFVDEMATNEQWIGQFAGVDSVVTTTQQSFFVNVRGESKEIVVNAGTTLKEFAAQVNAGNYGVEAIVYDSGAGGATPARIAFTDKKTGKFNADQTAGANFNLSFTSNLTNLSAGAFGSTPTIEGRDSKVFLNGDTANPIYRDTNTLSDAIPGVTLNLFSASTGSEATIGDYLTVTVSESSTNAAEKVGNFLQKFNNFVAAVKQATKIDTNPNAKNSATSGDSSLENMLNQITNLVIGEVSELPPGNTIRSLSALGVKSLYAKDSPTNGQLDFDQAKFDEALAANYDQVIQFFEGGKDGDIPFRGFGKKLNTALNAIVSPETGTFSTQIKGLAQQAKDLENEINKKFDRIEAQTARMKDKFARLEALMAKINSRGSAVNASLEQISANSKAARG